MSNLDIIRVPVEGMPKKSAMKIKDPSKQSYWMPRRAFLDILHEGVKEASSQITIMHDTKAIEIKREREPNGDTAEEASSSKSQIKVTVFSILYSVYAWSDNAEYIFIYEKSMSRFRSADVSTSLGCPSW